MIFWRAGSGTYEQGFLSWCPHLMGLWLYLHSAGSIIVKLKPIEDYSSFARLRQPNVSRGALQILWEHIENTCSICTRCQILWQRFSLPIEPWACYQHWTYQPWSVRVRMLCVEWVLYQDRAPSSETECLREIAFDSCRMVKRQTGIRKEFFQ